MGGLSASRAQRASLKFKYLDWKFLSSLISSNANHEIMTSYKSSPGTIATDKLVGPGVNVQLTKSVSHWLEPSAV